MRSPCSATAATTAPLRRQMEQSQRRGSTIPYGRARSSSTAPQCQEARFVGCLATPPTSSSTPGGLRTVALHELYATTDPPPGLGVVGSEQNREVHDDARTCR